MRVFHLHGDNIVECERTFALICSAISDLINSIHGPFGSPVCPSYEIFLIGEPAPLLFIMFPGFGRWNLDILALIRRRGGTLREAPDMILTAVIDLSEEPLLAIEYCGALPAGNQAWQRSGRAYSLGKSGVPYLYVAELGGYELTAERDRIAERLPNPAVPFSYLSFTLTNKSTVLPIFVSNPGASAASKIEYAHTFGEDQLLQIVRSVLLDSDWTAAKEQLGLKALSFIQTRASTSRSNSTLTPDLWRSAYEALTSGQSLVDFLAQNARLPWSKKVSISALRNLWATGG